MDDALLGLVLQRLNDDHVPSEVSDVLFAACGGDDEPPSCSLACAVILASLLFALDQLRHRSARVRERAKRHQSFVPIQIAVPEEALFVKESSAKPKSFLPGGFEVRTVNGGARQQGPAVARGGQGRAEPARRGSLDRSRLFSCRQPPSRKTAVRRSWLLGGGQTQRTSPLPLFGRAGLRFGCRPFLRVRHMVCFGHSQVGSFKYSASPNAGGPRRSSSSRPGCVRTSQPAASARQRISPSRRP